MGLSWQQGPLAPGAVGRFLVPGPLPERMLFAEPLRRRMRVRFGGSWIADSEDVVLLHEPGRYPVAYFPLAAVADGALQPAGHTTRHADLGPTTWYTVQAGEHSKPRAAWQHTGLPDYASELKGRVAFAWRAMEAFYEEDERIVGHAADPYHRIDIRGTSRHLVVRYQDQVIADTRRPLALYESGIPLPPARAGQYLTLRVTGAGQPAPVRSYSLSSAPGAGAYRISVKRKPHGAAGRYLNGRLREGATLQVAAPRGDFTLGDWKGGFAPGTDPDRRDYASFADFADPDGNTWVLQEIGYRGPA